jgi:phosphonate transport system substrate-binding protein
MKDTSLLHRGSSGHALAVTLAVMGLIGLLGWPARSDEPAKDPRKVRLRVLYSGTLFSGVNQNDALAALRVWIETLGRSRGFSLEAETDSFDRLEQADQRIQEDAADLVVFDTVQYLRTTQGGKLDPEFTAGGQHEPGKAPDDYVIVARRDCNLAALGDLRGKSVRLYKTGADWGHLWMDVMLENQGLGSVSEFFGSTSEFSKPSSVILPVFFGKCDAAVVRRWALNTMAEMNPQLATQLQIITNSPGLLEGVVCVHKNFKVFRNDLVQGLAELHTDPKGQQLMMLFKIEKLERFKPERLAAARELLARLAKARPSPARAEAKAVAGGKPKS